jgi:hypothetical protein
MGYALLITKRIALSLSHSVVEVCLSGCLSHIPPVGDGRDSVRRDDAYLFTDMAVMIDAS